jgi:hypothetical protein
MRHRYTILGMSLVCAGLLSALPLQAKECRISFHVTVLRADGSIDELCDVDPWGAPSITADLLPGDSLNIAWDPVECYGTISVEVHQSASSEPAGWSDPVVFSQTMEVNPFSWAPSPPLRFSQPGSFCIRASGTAVDFSAQLFVTVTDQLSTAVSDLPIAGLSVRYAEGDLTMDATESGQLRVLNSAGQRMLEQLIPSGAGAVRVAFAEAPGVYFASFITASGSRQGRFVVP